MAESHVVSALRAKRAELAGEVEAHERAIDYLRADLIHIDTVLRLYVPDEIPEAIPPKHPRPAQDDWFRRGELSRRIFDVLRNAETALCGREIALRIMQAKGFDPDDRVLAAKFTKRVEQALRRQRDKSALRVEPGPGQTLVWRAQKD